jgi:hypothetical protein
MANTIKAMYPISLQNDGKNDQERNVVNVNQERLNENFRNIATELIKLWESGDYTLNILSARIAKDEEVFVTVPDAEGIAAQAIATSSVILMMPESIMQQVAETINGYVINGDTTTSIQKAVASLVEQRADEIDIRFTNVTTVLGETADAVTTLSSWVKVVAANAVAGTNAGVIIGSSDSITSFKAEASCIFFYSGDDERAKWVNALAGLDADGNFIAKRAHIESMLIGDAFDVDVVTAHGVDFLHITGRA